VKRVTVLVLAVLIASGCGGPSSSASAPPPTDGPPGPEGFVLRTTVHQAIPPAAAFEELMPPVLIEDGIALLRAPQDAIFPPGLATILQQHAISEAGIARIVEAARAGGLLSTTTDFAPDAAPGSRTAEIVFVIDGVEHRVTGDPNRQIVCVTTPCEAAPGTPEAFGGFWAKLGDLNGLVGEELGPATVHEPEQLALLLTAPPLDATIPVEYADWPLEGVAMQEFGVELPGGSPSRCGIVEGADLPRVMAALRAANAYTRWRDSTGAELGIVSRPLFPGEPSPCEPA
jgi:hypothetical protein